MWKIDWTRLNTCIRSWFKRRDDAYRTERYSDAVERLLQQIRRRLTGRPSLRLAAASLRGMYACIFNCQTNTFRISNEYSTALNKERQDRKFDEIVVDDEQKLSHYGCCCCYILIHFVLFSLGSSQVWFVWSHWTAFQAAVM